MRGTVSIAFYSFIIFQSMSDLPPALDFPKAEEETCDRWKREGTFKTQDRLSVERGDEVRFFKCCLRLLLVVVPGPSCEPPEYFSSSSI